MGFIFKRKVRLLLLSLFFVSIFSLAGNKLFESQLYKEIEYYRYFFNSKKDGLYNIYDPLHIKQIPYETINDLYEYELSQRNNNNGLINWTKFAYVNYVTHYEYLCNTYLIFSQLIESGTKAKLLLLISNDVLDHMVSKYAEKAKNLVDKLKEIGPDQVIVKYVDNIIKPMDYTPWNKSLTKLLIFNQTEFERIIYLDNDSLVYDKLDELFFLPSYIKFGAPVNYWDISPDYLDRVFKEVKIDGKQPIRLSSYTDQLTTRVKKGQIIYNHLPNLPTSLFLSGDNLAKGILQSTSIISRLFNFHQNHKRNKVKFSSSLMVIKPSKKTFRKLYEEFLPSVINKKEQYDMDVINNMLYNIERTIYYQFKLFRRSKELFVPEVLVLPFKKYGLLTGSIRKKNHYMVMQNDVLGYKNFDHEGKETKESLYDIVKESKYIHFSDYPLEKPWNYDSISNTKCITDNSDTTNLEEESEACTIWRSIYNEYLLKRRTCPIS